MDIRKQLIILILVFLCAPVSAQKKEKLITLKFTYPIIRGYAKSGKAKRIHFLL